MLESAPRVKICGITTPKALSAAIDHGAGFAGFVFYPPSPRFIPPQDAAILRRSAQGRIQSVALFVDADDGWLRAVMDRVDPDMIQLHGGESPDRVREIRETFQKPVIKAIPVAAVKDVEASAAYQPICDWLLFDAKPSKPDMHGGTGCAFDWGILQGRVFEKPWMLAGGLNESNVGKALFILRPNAVDVSSGVETAPGVKDPEKIQKFMRAVMAQP